MRGRLQGDQIPQANRLERVVDRVVALRGCSQAPHPRDAQYYTQAGRVLGLLSDAAELTPRGEALVDAADALRAGLLIEAFEASAVGAQWIAFAGVERLADVSPETAEAFLLACSALSESTARRRASTLRYWWQALFVPPSELAVPVPSAFDGMPVSAHALFGQLLREPELSPAVLLSQVEQHVAAFRASARTNEFVDWEEATQLGDALHRLHARLAVEDATARRIWQATARYFLVVEDADSDFDIGGLDDDVSVFNAVARHLGHADLVVLST